MLRRTFHQPLLCAHHVLRTSTTKKLWGLRQQMRQKQQELSKIEQAPAKSDLKSPLPLSKRTPSEAALSITIPLESDLDVRAEYVNPVGGLRFGKLLEDLDAFTATIAFNHAHDFEKIRLGTCRHGPASIVTATVERIDLIDRIKVDHDLTMSGRVVWVGNASMSVKCELFDAKTSKKLLQSNFLLVTVNEKGKPIECNPLVLETQTDQLEFALAVKDNEERRAKRKAIKKANSQLIYDLQHLALDESTLEVIREKSIVQQKQKLDKTALTVAMNDTIQIATHLTQPQDANTAGKIFGGYLLQKAFEIGWVAAFSFLKTKPKFVCSDDVEFHRPVPAGSICVFTATVTYVRQPNLIEVSVRCEIISGNEKENENSSATLQKKLSNTFEFVFTPSTAALNEQGEVIEKKCVIPDVVCESYEDWVKYCRGKDVVDQGIAVGNRNGRNLRINQLI